MKPHYLERYWGSLQWTPWIPFSDAEKYRKQIPRVSGVYRIKPIGINNLAYIGQTGRDLRERVIGMLIKHTLTEEMPFNDPHTAAPSLWALTNAEGWEFEFSVAPVELSKESREGLECYLLWQYRIEAGQSTICNHGRFHADYVKSRNRKFGFRGGRLPEDGARNAAWGPCFSALTAMGAPNSNDFMGLDWNEPISLSRSNIGSIPTSPGVYRIIENMSGDLLYIGQSKALRNRLSNHVGKEWGEGKISFSYCVMDHATEVNLKEVENDLIGGFYSIKRRVPRHQFQNL